MDANVVKELSDNLMDAIKAYIGSTLYKRVNPVEQRLAAVEVRCGALSMIHTRGIAPDTVAALETMIGKVNALEARIAQLEANKK